MSLNRLLIFVTLMELFSETALSKPTLFLARCPNSPNCVSSQSDPSDKEHFIEPFKIIAKPASAWIALQKELKNQLRTEIIQTSDQSLHVEATSLIFRFVDDVNFLLDSEAGLIHVRSASRVGYGDFGVNRNRIEKLRQTLQQTGIIK